MDAAVLKELKKENQELKCQVENLKKELETSRQERKLQLDKQEKHLMALQKILEEMQQDLERSKKDETMHLLSGKARSDNKREKCCKDPKLGCHSKSKKRKVDDTSSDENRNVYRINQSKN